jgi:hypothetical protein
MAGLADLQLEVNPLALVSNLVNILHEARHSFRGHRLVKVTGAETGRYAIDDVLVQEVHHRCALQRCLSNPKIPSLEEQFDLFERVAGLHVSSSLNLVLSSCRVPPDGLIFV